MTLGCLSLAGLLYLFGFFDLGGDINIANVLSNTELLERLVRSELVGAYCSVARNCIGGRISLSVFVRQIAEEVLR